MDRLICLACLVIGYLFGIFQTAYILGRLQHVDVRKKGSGNLGTTNMFRVIGIRAGILTFVGDIGKVFVCALVIYLVFIKGLHVDIDRVTLFMYSGVGVILGHDFPCYLKFKGGKGVAATAAVYISLLDWRIILIGVIVFFAVAFATQYVSLASMCLATVACVSFIVFTINGWLQLGTRWFPDCYIISVFMTVLLIVQHRKNISRLLKHEESKFRFRSSKQIKENDSKENQ